MDSYFFVPGNRVHKLDTIKSLGVSQIIIDLEDAVKFSEREEIFKKFKNTENLKQHFVRIPLFNEKEVLDLHFLNNFIALGYTKFVFPKLNSFEEVSKVFNSINNINLQVILLIETPRLFLEAKEVLLTFKRFVTGIGIGSHDFMSVVGGEHSLKNLEFLRQQLLYLARMINITAIDIASMNLNEEEAFKEEVLDGFKKGYDAKFFIHPWQFKTYQELKLYSKEEYIWATKILTTLKEVGSEEEFNPIVIDGEVIERPHLNKAKKINKYYKK
ncbi:aldolase/citrate lyase family protein [uncultured Lacinutrix sp.]|uniref:HpcH/HpaI aldolase/citrate lyase family protein n=1 Tax=uncultured Lacinutrix sp. TaxID=574032 RepID=UPI002620FFC9|nr:aldolase/citrate lyase family protein [uncultured Lacinutrix sp.]